MRLRRLELRFGCSVRSWNCSRRPRRLGLSINWHVSEPSPALLVRPVAAASLDEADAAIRQWEHYSHKTLDSAQRLAVELMMAETSAGRWAARTTGRAEPRQNGKGDELEVVEAWGLIQRGEWIVHTAHEIPTAVSAHRRLSEFLQLHRDLRRRVRRVGYSHSDRSIEMTSGAIIVYRTRTAGGGRGLDDISRIVIDEAQWAQPEQLASSTPILAANPNPQTNFVGSAGIENRSDWWWSLRVRALRGDGSGFGYLEHSAEQVRLNQDDKVISVRPEAVDRSVWPVANPALGVRIEEEFLEEQLGILGPDLFSREHLCVWDAYPHNTEGFLPYDEWEGLVIDKVGPLASLSYGFSVVNGRGCVASAGRMNDGNLYVDTVRNDPGTEWVIEYLTDLHKRKKKPIRVNPAGGEGAFIRPLEEAGVKVEQVSARAYQNGCGEVLDTIKNGTIRHLGQSALSRAVRTAQRRDVGKEGAWVWADTEGDLSPLKAITLALTGVTKKRPPQIHTLEASE